MKKRLLVAAGIGLAFAGLMLLTVFRLDHPSWSEINLDARITQLQKESDAALPRVDLNGKWQGDADKLTNLLSQLSTTKVELMGLKKDRTKLQSNAAWFCEYAWKLSLLVLVVGLIWPPKRKPSC